MKNMVSNGNHQLQNMKAKENYIDLKKERDRVMNKTEL